MKRESKMKKKTVITSLLALTFLSLAACAPSPDSPSSSEAGESSSVSSADASSNESSEASSAPEVLTVSILAPEKTVLEIGEEEILEAKVEGSASEHRINWYSSAPEVLSVTQQGKIIALAAGTSEVTAKVGEFSSAPLLITVNRKKVPSVTLEAPSSTQIEVNQTLQLTAKTVDDEGLTLSFSADNDNVEVSAEGLVTGKKAGTSHVVASLGEGIVSNAIEITVLEESKDLSVTLKALEKEIFLKGETFSLEAEVKGNVNSYPVVYSSSAPEVASVSEEGLVTAVSAGTATLSASVHGVSASVSIRVLDAYDPVESIRYVSSAVTLAKGESLVLEKKDVSILPITSDQSFTLTSSNSKLVSVDVDEISAKGLTGDTPVTVTLRAGEASFDIAVTVVTAKTLHAGEVKAKLEKAAASELTQAKSGHFYMNDKNAAGEDTTYEKFDFKVYSDSKSEVHYQKKATSSWANADQRITWTKLGDSRLIKASQDLADGAVKSSFYSSYNIVPDDSSSTEYSDVKASVAEKALNLPIVNTGNDASKMGFAQSVLNTYFPSSGHTFFSEDSLSELVDTFTFSQTGNVYTLGIDSMATASSSSKDHVDLTLEFEGDLLKSVSGTVAHFKGETDWDTDKTIWSANGSTVLDGALEVGEREASPADSFSAESLLATSFDAQFYTGYGASKKVATSFGVNVDISYEAINVVPETWNKDVDPISISFPGHEDIVKKSSYGFSFKVTEEIADLEVVVSTLNVSKTYHLSIKELKTQKLAFAKESMKTFVGEKLSEQVNFDKNAVTDLAFSVVGDNADKATITVNSLSASLGYCSFYFTATEQGTYSIEASDAKTGLKAKATVTVLGNSDAELVDFLTSSSWSGDHGSKNIAMSKQEDGSIKLVMTVSCTDDYYDDVYVKATIVFNVTDGKLVFVSSANDNSDSELTCTSIAFASGKHSSLLVKFSINSEWSVDNITLTAK